MAILMVNGEPVVTDYVLVTNAYAESNATSSRTVEPFDPPMQIHGDIWIGQLDTDLCTKLLDATDRTGENWRPTRQFSCSYAFYRANAPTGPGPELLFDADDALYTCVALSRIVHPTAVGFERAVSVRRWSDGTRKIIPCEFINLNPYAFVIDSNENWLIPSDIPILRMLIEAKPANPPPARLASALWHFEAVSRNYFIDLRWPLLTTCLESLVKIKDEFLPKKRPAGSTKVFVDRLLAIGNMDPALAVPESDLRAMYEERSLLTHGLAFVALDESRNALYRTQERLARGIIRKALLDPTFRAIFASDAALAAGLPLRP